MVTIKETGPIIHNDIMVSNLEIKMGFGTVRVR